MVLQRHIGNGGKTFVFEIYHRLTKKYVTAFHNVDLDNYETKLEDLIEADEPFVFAPYDDGLCKISPRDEGPIPTGPYLIDGEVRIHGTVETEDGRIS